MVDDNKEELRHKLHWLLRDFRNLIEEKKYFIYPHQKNKETLIRHNLTLRQRENYIYNLNMEDYVAGPKQDEQHSGIYWEFGIFIDDDPIYIKLKIATDQHGNDFGFCYSFHDAEFPLKFPLSDA
jgi:hypothetical protein